MKCNLGLAAIITAWILALSLVSTPVRAEEKTDNSSSNMEILREKIKADSIPLLE